MLSINATVYCWYFFIVLKFFFSIINLFFIELQSDAWSFGVLFWELLTRETPYENMEEAEIIKGIKTKLAFNIA